MNRDLNFKIRQQKGKVLKKEFVSALMKSGIEFQEQFAIDLPESDLLLEKQQMTFQNLKLEYELISISSDWTDSNLLLNLIRKSKDNEFGYVYTDEVSYCGMYKADLRCILSASLNIAKNSKQGSCHVVDLEFSNSVTINYYDDEHADFKNSFEIQMKKV